MTYDQFMAWLEKLDLKDRKFLSRRAEWRKEFNKASLNRVLPKGFLERTMEILEGGSESET
jgi:hypothetical protein